MDKQTISQAEKYCGYISNLCRVPCVLIDATDNQLYLKTNIMNELCRTCQREICYDCFGIEAFIHGYRQAYQWDGMYIYLCKAGLVLVATSISDEKGNLIGGMVAGPVCLGSRDESMEEIFDEKLRQVVGRLPQYTSAQIQSLGEIMSALCSQISGISNGKSGAYFYRQENLLNELYAQKLKKSSDSDYYTYPFALERKLRMAIRRQDKAEAQVILNQILAYIYESNGYNLERIKPRIMELLIVTSRAAIDGGASASDIQFTTQQAAVDIDKFTVIEDLTAWLSVMLHQYISDTFDFQNAKHGDVIYKVVEYINQNYMKKITLEDIAKNTYISKTYLSSVFKKETGDSIFNYINRVRVEKSKVFLTDEDMSIVEVGNQCGFESQSYFTKVFKSIIGITPKKYKEESGKNNRI